MFRLVADPESAGGGSGVQPPCWIRHWMTTEFFLPLIATFFSYPKLHFFLLPLLSCFAIKVGQHWMTTKFATRPPFVPSGGSMIFFVGYAALKFPYMIR